MCEDGPDRTGLPDTPRLAFADQSHRFEATDKPHDGNATDNRTTGDAGGRSGHQWPSTHNALAGSAAFVTQCGKLCRISDVTRCGPIRAML